MKIQTHPAAGGLVASLYYLLAIVLLLQAACAVREVRGRDPRIALESSVVISIVCAGEAGGFVFNGSGVIVDSNTVLTAAHVAEDPEGLTCVRTATMVNGKAYLLAPGVTLHDYDLASLHPIFEAFFPTYPVVYGPPPEYGSRVCSMTAYPRHLWRCGEVQLPADPPGDLAHTIITEGGNSGSGVYDERGRLVGIVTHRWECGNGQHCGGKMALLTDHLADLLR